MTQQTTLPLKAIVPDVNQPRQYFDATKMFQLKESIKQNGVMSPLIVEDMGDGKYLLIDGERRFRASTELKLKDVPVIIEPPQDETTRLIRQFNIQEHHEAWSPLEKAKSIISLSDKLGLTLPAVCKRLGLGKSQTDAYVAFATLADQEAFLKSETPLEYATMIRTLKVTAKRLSEHSFRKEFTKGDERKIEHRVISMIREGVVTKRKDLVELKDAFTKNPKLIQKFITDQKTTPTGLFMEAGAQGAYALRNMVYNATYMAGNAQTFLAERDVELSTDQKTVLERARDLINKVLEVA